jgi:S-adenosylmethionine:tRNA ribosyltransferase-isomerase
LALVFFGSVAMRTDDFDFDLPPELIAQRPPAERGASRLLYLNGVSGELQSRRFGELLNYVRAGDVAVFNDTRVIKARLLGKKATGGAVEVLVERVRGEHEALVQIRASKPPVAGGRLHLGDGVTADVLERRDAFYVLKFEGEENVFNLLERFGSVPLPPYVEREADAADEARYQTVFAKHPGAVAAPTAGLHFDEAMLTGLRENGVEVAYVTLHVGAGTFQPVRVTEVAEHVMHYEWFEIPEMTVATVRAAQERGGRVLAVGTTTLRALESAASAGEIAATSGETNLFIVPGYRFRVVDRLLTNFHLPRSTLLMLVSAFGGVENIRRAYALAIKQGYRFYSYGDAMLIDRSER